MEWKYRTKLPTNYECAYCGSDRNVNSLIRTTHFTRPIFACGQCKLKHKKKIIAKPGFIYMIGCDQFWKIGRTSTHPEIRMKELQNGNPHTLKLAGFKMVDDCLVMEALYHKKLNQYHFRGEWFQGNEEDMKIILGF